MTLLTNYVIGPPLNLAPPQIYFWLRSPPPSLPNYFGLKFLGPLLKLGELLPFCSSVSIVNFKHVIVGLEQ